MFMLLLRHLLKQLSYHTVEQSNCQTYSQALTKLITLSMSGWKKFWECFS